MAKDPAFLFYVNDYLGGTMGMTFEEKGAYVELLLLQFNRGPMSEQMIAQVVGPLWAQLKNKFAQDEAGLFFNKRLKEEKEKRQQHAEHQRLRAIKGWEVRKAGQSPGISPGNAPALPLENENENENRNRNVNVNKGGAGGKFKVPTIEVLKDYFFQRLQDKSVADHEAEKFYDFYESKGWMVGKTKMKAWKSSVNNWIRGIKKDINGTDKFSPEAIKARMERWK